LRELRKTMTCRKTNGVLAELLVAPQSSPAELREHVANCADCASELARLEATMKVLDEWQAPEPGAFFDAKLFARLRREAEAGPAGWLERAKAWLLYGSNIRSRHWAAGVLAVAFAIGGGTFAVVEYGQPDTVQASATVRDLQSYNGNAQLFEQLTALDTPDDVSANASN
jgi:hypothetical protein